MSWHATDGAEEMTAIESSEIASRSHARSRTISRVRSTFMVEAMLLLTIVMVLVAITLSLLAFSGGISARAQHLQQASDIAQNAAERFVADPLGFAEVQDIGEYRVLCDIDESPRPSGSLYEARIYVTLDDEEICSVDVCRYISARDEA